MARQNQQQQQQQHSSRNTALSIGQTTEAKKNQEQTCGKIRGLDYVDPATKKNSATVIVLLTLGLAGRALGIRHHQVMAKQRVGF